MDSDSILNKAWIQVTSSAVSKLKLSNLLVLFDVLEVVVNYKILTNEYREFLVEFIIECPNVQVDQYQFMSLIERLFECPFTDIIKGNLVKKYENNTLNRQDFEDYTQTMNLESAKFNSFLNDENAIAREDILKNRIAELESMLMNSRDDRTVGKIKDMLINYYKTLNEIKLNYKSKNTQLDKILERLKSDIDKQDIIINELKRKVNDEKGVIDQLKLKFAKTFRIMTSIGKFAIVILIIQILVSVIGYLIYGDDRLEISEYETINNDEYW